MQLLAEPRHIEVRSELDIVTLRHTVRQFARAIGLDLPRQAKVTVAISAVARAFIGDSGDALFTVQISSNQPRPALEISCISSNTHYAQSPEQLETQLNIQEVRLLVDEFIVALQNQRATLRMRMWLAS
jgi:hypothetical protein